jgi:hypothetical protein
MLDAYFITAPNIDWDAFLERLRGFDNPLGRVFDAPKFTGRPTVSQNDNLFLSLRFGFNTLLDERRNNARALGSEIVARAVKRLTGMRKIELNPYC